MEVLIDASAILAVLLNETEKESIRALSAGLVLIAPACIEYEVGNVISALFKRKLIEISDGIAIWHEFCKIPVRLLLPQFPDSIMLAGSEAIYAYDAYYLSCAEQMQVPLLTLDTTMRRVAERRGIACLEV